jgi:hypothetical protein
VPGEAQQSQEKNLATVSTTTAVTTEREAARPRGNPMVQSTTGNQQNQPGGLGTTGVEGFVQERQRGPNRGTPKAQQSQEKHLATVSTTTAVTTERDAARPRRNPMVQSTTGNQQNQPGGLGTTGVEGFVQERKWGPNEGTPEAISGLTTATGTQQEGNNDDLAYCEIERMGNESLATILQEMADANRTNSLGRILATAGAEPLSQQRWRDFMRALAVGGLTKNFFSRTHSLLPALSRAETGLARKSYRQRRRSWRTLSLPVGVSSASYPKSRAMNYV